LIVPILVGVAKGTAELPKVGGLGVVVGGPLPGLFTPDPPPPPAQADKRKMVDIAMAITLRRNIICFFIATAYNIRSYDYYSKTAILSQTARCGIFTTEF
jgi:hypothetical protein